MDAAALRGGDQSTKSTHCKVEMKGVMEPPWQPDYSCFICPTLSFPHSFYGLDLRRRYKGFSLSVKVWDREDPTVLRFRCGVLPDLPEAGTRRPAVTIRTGIDVLLSQPPYPLLPLSKRFPSSSKVAWWFSENQLFLLLSASCQTQLCRVSVHVLTIPRPEFLRASWL